MTPKSSPPEASDLRRRGRQRLIGAIVLVLLLVVFVPMLLDSEPRTPRESPALTIPSKTEAPPLPAPAAAVPAVPAPAVAPSAQAAKADAPPPEAVARVEAAKPGPASVAVAATKSPESPPAAAAGRAGFVVQVGAFRDEAKLKQAQGKLQAAGVVHYTERLEGKSGALTRLRAGPYATREEAEAAQVAVKRATLDGKVIPLP